jgi:hypothetical protein
VPKDVSMNPEPAYDPTEKKLLAGKIVALAYRPISKGANVRPILERTDADFQRKIDLQLRGIRVLNFYLVAVGSALYEVETRYQAKQVGDEVQFSLDRQRLESGHIVNKIVVINEF